VRTLPDTLEAEVDVYAVGVLRDLRIAWRYARRGWWLRAWDQFRRVPRHPVRHIRARQWRELRNDFNGFLAEPTWRGEPEWTRAGTGWTRRRALRNLARHLSKEPTP
jgi:hypothetical protein